MSRSLPTDSDIPMHGWAPYDDIHRERIRAHEKHDATERLGWYDMLKWLAIVGEEWGEVSRAINEYHLGNLGLQTCRAELRSELVQTAAMCAAWIDAIDDHDA